MTTFQTILFIAVFGAIPISAAGQEHRLTWFDPIEVAQGNSVRGEWKQNESNYDHVDDGTPALDERGNTAVAWVDQKRKDVFFQAYARTARSGLPSR